MRHTRRGFTLIEVLTAITIALLIVGAVSAIFSQATRIFASAQGRLQIDQQARAVFDLLERDLQGAVIVNTGAGDRYFYGNGTTLQFLTTTGSAGAEDHAAYTYDVDLVEVLYHFDETGKKLHRIVRMANTQTPSALSAIAPILPAAVSDDSLLVDGVFKATDPANGTTPVPAFRFCTDPTGATFADTCTVNGGAGGKPPLAVRIYFRFTDSTGRFKEDIGRAIFIPGGR